MPLDQQATHMMQIRLNSGKFWCYGTCWMGVFYFYFTFISKSVWSHQFANIFHFFFVLQLVGSHSDSFNYLNRIFEVRHQCSAAQQWFITDARENWVPLFSSATIMPHQFCSHRWIKKLYKTYHVQINVCFSLATGTHCSILIVTKQWESR